MDFRDVASMLKFTDSANDDILNQRNCANERMRSSSNDLYGVCLPHYRLPTRYTVFILGRQVVVDAREDSRTMGFASSALTSKFAAAVR